MTTDCVCVAATCWARQRVARATGTQRNAAANNAPAT